MARETTSPRASRREAKKVASKSRADQERSPETRVEAREAEAEPRLLLFRPSLIS